MSFLTVKRQLILTATEKAEPDTPKRLVILDLINYRDIFIHLPNGNKIRNKIFQAIAIADGKLKIYENWETIVAQINEGMWAFQDSTLKRQLNLASTKADGGLTQKLRIIELIHYRTVILEKQDGVEIHDRIFQVVANCDGELKIYGNWKTLAREIDQGIWQLKY